jgi:hypothetical protein
METKLMWTTAGSMLCLCDERGTIVGWIPFPVATDVFGPGREKVYLARAAATAPAATTSRAA